MKKSMKLLILGALAAAAMGAGPVQRRLGQVQAQTNQFTDDLDFGDLAEDCTCPPFTIGLPPGVGAGGSLASYDSAAMVAQSVSNEQIPNTASETTCLEQCCACAISQEASASASQETKHYEVMGSINVEESLIYCHNSNAWEQSIAENEKLEVCSISNQNGGSGSVPDCVVACTSQEEPDGSGNPGGSVCNWSTV